MLNLDTKFYQFIENIKLSESKMDMIRNGRDAIREKIKNSFSDDGKKQPTFRMQGWGQ